MEPKSLYYVKIVHVDLIDVPPARSTTVTRKMELTDKEAQRLRKKAQRLFAQHADGNDEYYELVMIKIGAAPEWQAKDFEEYLKNFKHVNMA